MIFKKGMSLVITVVNAGFSQQVVEASKKVGADGATILSGRGTSRHETTSVLGVQIQPEKEVVLILVRKSFRKDIMKQIVRACNLASEGRGLTFCLPVDEVAGINHLFRNGTFKKPEFEKQKAEEKCDAIGLEQAKKDEQKQDKQEDTKPVKEESKQEKITEEKPVKDQQKNTEQPDKKLTEKLEEKSSAKEEKQDKKSKKQKKEKPKKEQKQKPEKPVKEKKVKKEKVVKEKPKKQNS